jgi:multiple sugar transport system substrate-binding protein
MLKFIAGGLIPANPDNVVQYMKQPGRFPRALVDDNLASDGKHYGLNYFQGRHVVFWNKDMFKAAGLSAGPGTMQELVSFAQKTAKRDAQGNLTVSGLSLRLSGGGSGVGEKFWMWLYPNGGSIIERTASGKYHAGYNNDAGLTTLKGYLDMVWKLKVDDHKIKHDAEAFALGQTAMFARESWVIGNLKKNAPTLQYDTVPMPKGVRWGDLATGVNLYVSRSSKAAATAWDFCLFLNNDASLRTLIDESGWLPQRLDADLKASLDKEPRYKAFLFSDPNYQIYTYPPLPEYDEILTKFAERMVKAFLDPSLVDNTAAMRKILADAAEETNSILKRGNHYGES